MLAINQESVSLASAFAIGFTIGVVTTLRLLNFTFNASQKVFRKISSQAGKHSIDRTGPDAVDKSEEGNPP